MWALSLVPTDDVVDTWENCIGPEYVAFLRDDAFFKTGLANSIKEQGLGRVHGSH